MTYYQFLINMGKAADLEAYWRMHIKSEDRKEAAASIVKYMRQHWYFRFTSPWRYMPPDGGLTKDELVKLRNFFFMPKDVILIYAFE